MEEDDGRPFKLRRARREASPKCSGGFLRKPMSVIDSDDDDVRESKRFSSSLKKRRIFPVSKKQDEPAMVLQKKTSAKEEYGLTSKLKRARPETCRGYRRGCPRNPLSAADDDSAVPRSKPSPSRSAMRKKRNEDVPPRKFHRTSVERRFSPPGLEQRRLVLVFHKVGPHTACRKQDPVFNSRDIGPPNGNYGKIPNLLGPSSLADVTRGRYAKPGRSTGKLGSGKYGVKGESSNSQDKVKEVIGLYREIVKELLRENDGYPTMQKNQIYMKAASLLRRRHGWINEEKRLGPVPGVEIGDKFCFRAEMNVIGLHRQFTKGIDYMRVGGILLAASVVASGRYPNDMRSLDEITYIGQGGNPSVQSKSRCRIKDQEPVRGNLALMNSMERQTRVRVVRCEKFKAFKASKVGGICPSQNLDTMYVYDGLYLVKSYKQDRCLESGKLVYKFTLRRVEGQPPLLRGMVSKRRNCKSGNVSLLMKDISQGQESMPIRVVNMFDDERPPHFTYRATITYPQMYNVCISAGCDCVDGCSDSKYCSCKSKNGGDIPYNDKGCLVRKKPLIFECGPSCKCFASCLNKVSQRGIQFQLKLFKIEAGGWGLRSRSYIPSGSFVCEFVGEIREKKKVEKIVCHGNYMFDIGTGIIIDATELGNVGRFINHGRAPNLCAQKVLYDHSDNRVPHVVLFAAKNIHPSQELTCDYNSFYY